MQTKIIPFSKFHDDMRNVVLRSLDAFAAVVMETEKVKGWNDQELKALFVGVDAHAKALAARINAGHEVNSAYVRIDMES
jgi:D-aminopeptidase